MDTDEASKHTQNILERVNKEQEEEKLVTRLVELTSIREPELSTEDMQGDSDLDTTVLERPKPLEGKISDCIMTEKGVGEPLGEIDTEGQRSFVRTLRYGTPPPSLGVSPTTTKLTFGLSKSLENMSINPSEEGKTLRADLGMEYANNEFYLPIAGCPGVSELEPQLTDQLTLKGNKAKLLHIPLWHHTYYTSSYLIDDVTGELYVRHQDELIAIKEQGYLQKEMAEEEYLNSRGKEGAVYLAQEENTRIQKGFSKESLKVPQPHIKTDQCISTGQEADRVLRDELMQQNKNTINEATDMLQEYQGNAHQQAVTQWNLKRRERKQLERDLLRYQARDIAERFPTDQEVEEARMFIKNEHTRKLKEELPYIAQYFETIPIETGINENDGLLESSAGSYEAREEWTKQDYRKLMINFNRNEAQYEVDRMVTELAIQRDPENLAAIEEEYTKGRELLNYRQKRGHDLLKVAKAYADYTRRQG